MSFSTPVPFLKVKANETSPIFLERSQALRFRAKFYAVSDDLVTETGQETAKNNNNIEKKNFFSFHLFQETCRNRGGDCINKYERNGIKFYVIFIAFLPDYDRIAKYKVKTYNVHRFIHHLYR